MLDVVAIGAKDVQLVAKAVGITNVLFWDTKGRPQAVIEVHVGTPYTHIERSIRRSLHNDSIVGRGCGKCGDSQGERAERCRARPGPQTRPGMIG